MSKRKMKLDTDRYQRWVQFHTSLYRGTVAEEAIRIDREPHLLKVYENCVL